MARLVFRTKVRDVITGLRGLYTGRAEYDNGCVQLFVAPPVDKDGKFVDGVWLDEGRIEAIEDQDIPQVEADIIGKSPGGPAPRVPPPAL